MDKAKKMGNKGKIRVKGGYGTQSRFDKEGIRKKKSKKIWLRRTLTKPFPTNYLPTIPLKLSAIMRYYQFKKEVKRADRAQRKERDLETSKYSVLVGFLEKELDTQREKLIEEGKGESIMLIKINPKFDGVIGKVIQYVSVQDNVTLVNLNRNYEKMKGESQPHLLMVEIVI